VHPPASQGSDILKPIPDGGIKSPFLFSTRREGIPLVFGHRGARSYAPMNTIPSFELAIRQGAQGIELDVQLTADRKLIVLHDFTVDRTTEGYGAVRNLRFAELRELDASARFARGLIPLDKQPCGPFAHVQIPTLEEVFVLVRDAARPDFIVNVEIKAPYCCADGSENPDDIDGIEEVTAACIDRFGMAGRVIISSFNPPTLGRFRNVRPGIPVGLLVESESPVDAVSLAEGFPREAWHPPFSMVNGPAVLREKNAGRMINVWTVNDPAEAQRLAGLGVHGIITDTPDRILNALGYRTQSSMNRFQYASHDAGEKYRLTSSPGEGRLLRPLLKEST
jgi:glycerophosphoryl diester phosphodiesterase